MELNESKLKDIHSKLRFDFGSLNDEYPEQLLTATFLTGNEKVLEFGGNIGRNSMIIGYILNQNNNTDFVTLETYPIDAQRLQHNRDNNGLKFHIENAALSKKRLFQNLWLSIESDTPIDGHYECNTMTLEQLNNKYNINFDTLVVDCEGAFYYILRDMPEILNNIKLIIIENDFRELEQKIFVDNLLIQNNFKIVYENNFTIDVNVSLYKFHFYEVWRKDSI